MELWIEQDGGTRWRAQVEDRKQAKALERSGNFRKVAASVAGGFLAVYAFEAQGPDEARRMVAGALRLEKVVGTFQSVK